MYPRCAANVLPLLLLLQRCYFCFITRLLARHEPCAAGARARRHALHPSLRALVDSCGASAPGETGHFSLTVTVDGAVVRLVAHLRRITKRRHPARPVKASKPPARDPRQGDLF
ncbi:hypothetical protein PQR53_33495 [Paraburkholderia fungorum]|uniref:hypothetical protein n=1 Tax=Paraburkholderia fungorum TaxID=134537 RepID=UPI0038B6D13E